MSDASVPSFWIALLRPVFAALGEASFEST